jgi:hypothetical protein
MISRSQWSMASSTWAAIASPFTQTALMHGRRAYAVHGMLSTMPPIAAATHTARYSHTRQTVPASLALRIEGHLHALSCKVVSAVT